MPTNILSAEAAAWVQALGSVVAIFAGFLFVLFQQGQERAARARSLATLCRTLVLTADHIASTLKSTNEEYPDQVAGELDDASQTLTGNKEVLFSLDFSMLEGDLVWQSLAEMTARLDRCIRDFADQAVKAKSAQPTVNDQSYSALLLAQLAEQADETANQVVRHYRLKPIKPKLDRYIKALRDYHAWLSNQKPSPATAQS